MKNLLFIIYFMVILSINAFSQKETYIGLNHSFLVFDIYSFEDKGPLIKNAIVSDFPIKIHSVELFLGRELTNKIYFETGIRIKNYLIGYNSEYDENEIRKFFLYTYQIPIRFKYEYFLSTRFSIKPYIGLIYCIDRGSDDHWFLDPIYQSDDYVITGLYENGFKQSFLLAHTGMDFEYHINKRHSLVLNMAYAKGFTDLVIQKVSYFNYNLGADNSLYESTVTGRGDYLMFSLSYKFNFIAKKNKVTKSENLIHKKIKYK